MLRRSVHTIVILRRRSSHLQQHCSISLHFRRQQQPPAIRAFHSTARTTAATVSTTASSLSSSFPKPGPSLAERTMRFGPFVFLTTAAFLSSSPGSRRHALSVTRAEARPAVLLQQQQSQSSSSSPSQQQRRYFYSQSDSNNKNNNNDDKPPPRDPSCPFYGCPLTPHDVHYNIDVVKEALAKVRDQKRNQVDPASLQVLQQSVNTAAAGDAAVTFTLIGYKGGPLLEQINQDRAVIVSPFYIDPLPGSEADKQQQRHNTTNRNRTTVDSPPHYDLIHQKRILLGVFDGHAPLGERVADFTAHELPKLLANKLYAAFQQPPPLPKVDNNNNSNNNNTREALEQYEMETTVRILTETFIELDQRAPADPSGGCTATIVLLQGRKVYVANAGDSRSFLVTYRPSTQHAEIVYMTREDKPSLPEEQARVEAAGGHVYIPIRGTSRVVYHDPLTGAPTGLAMSRSIGDWAAGKLGVIPDPIVHVLDVDTLVSSQLHAMDAARQPNGMSSSSTSATASSSSSSSFEVNAQGQATPHDATGTAHAEPDDDVHIFAVSATDGMMDYLEESEIAKILAHALFAESGAHPVSACEHLIFAAAHAWQQAKLGRYRDDIAIAVSAIRRPPSSRDNSAAKDSPQQQQ